MPYPNGQALRTMNAAGILGWVNLLDAGGVGDGVRDDSKALNGLCSALTSALESANIGGTIVIPPGTYLLSSNVSVPANVTVVIASGATFTGAGVLSAGSGFLVDLRIGTGLIYVTSPVLTAASASQALWTAPASGTFQLASVDYRLSAQSTSGTLQVEVAPTATAIGGGTNQLGSAASLSASGPAVNTNSAPALIASPTSITNASSVNLILAGTLTGLAGLVVTLGIQRLT